MTKDDWRALIEQFLADEIDASVFREDFLEVWQECVDEQETVPPPIEELYSAVEAFEQASGDADELQEDARRALELLKT